MMERNTVVVITGPTATGKTALGVALALEKNGEVVSADSMQLYRGMVIGTAAPTPEETRGVPHHMVGVADPRESYSVSRYVEEAGRCVDDILSRGKLPILVGGTGLYIESLLAGREFARGDGPSPLRASLGEEYDRLGGAAMLEKLARSDPEAAARLHPNDKKRIVRALEVCALTGETISAHDRRTKSLPPRYRSARIALTFSDRQELYRRIDKRVEDMMAAGLLEEVKTLLAAGLDDSCTAMQAIGYKEMCRYLRGECTLEEALAAVQQGSRRYAKRQLSWLARDKELHWIRWEKTPDFGFALRDSTAFLSAFGL